MREVLNVLPTGERGVGAESKGIATHDPAAFAEVGWAIGSDGLERIQVERRQLDKAGVLTADSTTPTPQLDILRRIVLQGIAERTSQTLAVASPTAGCGSTFTALNLAWGIARQRERRVILIDANIREPDLTARLGLKQRPGLSDYLRGTSELRECIVEVDGNGQRVYVMPTGTADNPAELLASSRMASLVGDLRRAVAGAVIIFDTHPLLSFDDTIGLLPVIDHVLLVVAAGKTRQADVGAARYVLRNGHIVAVSLNEYL